MKIKHNVKILFILLFAIATLLILTNRVEAANANISCNTTGTVNEPIKITVTGTGVQWNLKLMVNGNQIASSSELDNYEGNKNISFSGTYTPTTTGSINVTLVGSVTEFSDGSTKTSFTPKSITINPKPEENPKPNPEPQPEDPKPETPTPAKATMTKVQVGDKTYTKTDFTVKVANDVTSIKVVPTISNGESYTINGGTSNEVKLEEGTNTVRIKLASGNLYKIYIRREAKEDDTPNIIDDPEKDPEVKVGLKSLLIKGVTQEGETIELSYAPEFFSEIYEYQMLLDETLSNITKLDVEAVGLQDDFTIEIKGNEELKEGENTITILVKSKDGKTSATYTIVVTKEAKAEEVIAPVDNTEETRKPLWNTTQKIVITVFTSIVAILGIIFAVVEYRYQKNHKQGKEEVEEENKKEEVEEEVKYSAISLEEESKEEISGDVPFAKIGFENEVDKVDVLKDEQEVKFQEIEEENSEVEEELKKQTKSKKGKHF